MPVTCFWLEPTGTVQVGLRRYQPLSQNQGSPCPRDGGKWGYHGALVLVGESAVTWLDKCPPDTHFWLGDRDGNRYGVPDFTYPGHDDPRWPTHCECGYVFSDCDCGMPDCMFGDVWQEWGDPLYQRVDTGERMTLRDTSDGAMWDAYWYPQKGPDGRSLMVKCPGGGEWAIDSRASNCTMPDDDVHRCWVRHGEPPVITVDKAGLTCPAGGGSIVAGGYHGMLQNGVFT